MTYKKAIAIGLLASAGIGLLVFGIKTGTFKKENIGKTTTPISYNLNKKRNTPLRVDAEDLYPISKKWLMNSSNIQYSSTLDITTNYTTWIHPTSGNNALKINGTRLYADVSNYSNGTVVEIMTQPNSTYWAWYNYQQQSGRYQSRKFNNNASRIIEFNTEPTGDLYTLVNTNGLPAYNNDILIFGGNIESKYQNGAYTFNYAYQDNCINEIRKSTLQIDKNDIRQGKFINESGTIQLFLDAGITSLKINGTEYIGSETETINITNDDIMIESQGTPSGNTSSIFTINYFNTRPPITPQPYPDPGDRVIEVLDITGLMFQILTMPFTFISQAFNLTLWEGTPYQFNFSNLILSLIAIATIIFIIKLFTSGFSVIGNYTSHRADTKLKNSQTKLNEAKTKKIETKTPKKE